MGEEFLNKEKIKYPKGIDMMDELKEGVTN